ncbi:MAG TPA: sensor domain-containing diguanylate cyclase [Candidatus Deferrimicrobium sp.]|nr:sensor domain-containing diguanylate cyclase [Candidatus Deferrimicrobium sp.]
MALEGKKNIPGNTDTPYQYEATIQALLNATSDLPIIIDTKGIILNVGEGVTTRTGKESNHLIGTCIYDYFKPEHVDFKKAYVQLVTQSRQMIRFEDHFEDLTFLVCIYPILDQNNEVEKLAVFINDSTELNKNEMLLHRYSQILAAINDPIAYIDVNFLYRTVNDATLKIYRKTMEEMIGHPMEEVVGKEVFAEKFKPYIEQCLTGERVYHKDWFDFPDGQPRFMYISLDPLFAKNNIVAGVVIDSIDITKMKEMEDQLKLLSQTDQLTQVFNRVKFNDSLNYEMIRSKRYQTDLSLIMIDIDYFKDINDKYGHDMGDDVLKALAGLLKESTRETDICARWGGEEFMLLLPHTNLENASKLAERIRARIEKKVFKTGQTVTGSFGVTQFISADTDETFTKRVDRALYMAKEKGRNRVISAQAKTRDAGNIS